MRQYQQTIVISTDGKGFKNFTRELNQVVSESGIKTGICHIFLRHTSASLVIQENADPDVLRDLNNFFKKLVPENRLDYFHTMEGLDDMPAHIRTALTHTSESVPITQRHLVLGTWQGIYVWEHRNHSHRRELFIHIIGE